MGLNLLKKYKILMSGVNAKGTHGEFLPAFCKLNFLNDKESSTV